MKFGELVKTSSPELVISRRYDNWIAANANPTYSLKALDFGRQAMLDQATPRDRRGTISGSSLGKCMRRQQFTFLGVPEMPYSARTSAIFVNGTFMHIRWQMAGLTDGWLAEAEVPIPENELNLSGTMDGIADEGSVVELKSCNSNHFSRVMTFGPLGGHEEQLATYLLATGREKGILLYENKDTQEYTEIVKTRDELPLESVEIRSRQLWESCTSKKLVEPLDAAYENKFPCSSCAFRNKCLSIKSWQHAEEISDAARR